jgi:8-oxo-dGTP pyrophosphatase MutT (NUDIX family)
MNTDSRPEVAIAILQRHEQFLLQLRDNIPGILYPGYWGLFGGHLEPGETADQAIRRELLEEIAYVPASLLPFGCYADERVIRQVYYGVLDVGLAELRLQEGWDMELLTVADIQRGDRYSRQADQVRPLGPVHQTILLDFIQSRPVVSLADP